MSIKRSPSVSHISVAARATVSATDSFVRAMSPDPSRLDPISTTRRASAVLPDSAHAARTIEEEPVRGFEVRSAEFGEFAVGRVLGGLVVLGDRELEFAVAEFVADVGLGEMPGRADADLLDRGERTAGGGGVGHERRQRRVEDLARAEQERVEPGGIAFSERAQPGLDAVERDGQEPRRERGAFGFLAAGV